MFNRKDSLQIQPELNPADISALSPNIRDRGSSNAMNFLAVCTGFAVLAASVVFAANRIGDIDVNVAASDIPNVDELVEVDPVEAEVMADFEAVEIDGIMNLSCLARIIMPTDVDSFANGKAGDGHWKTKSYYSAIACGTPVASISNTVAEQLEGVEPPDMEISGYSFDAAEQLVPLDEVKDPVTGQITSVTVTVPGLSMISPQYDAMDPRNCLGTDTYKASPEEVKMLLDEFLAKREQGEAKCENGFYIGQFFVGEEASRAITFGQKAVQFGLLHETLPEEMLAGLNADYKLKIEESLSHIPRYENATIYVNVNSTLTSQEVEAFQASERRRYAAEFEEVTIETNDEGQTVVHIKDSGGDKAEITLNSDPEAILETIEIINNEPQTFLLSGVGVEEGVAAP